MVDEIMGIIDSIKGEGATIVIAEQKITPSLSRGDIVVVLSRGEIIYKGSRGDIDPKKIASMVMSGNYKHYS